MNSSSYSDRLRAMYQGGRADATARRYARVWSTVFGFGLVPRRWVTLEVTGRSSGRVTRFPLGMADRNGERYLVPMLGERCNWVQNVRAAGGQATLRHGRAIACRLVELPVGERAPVIKRYLQQVPGARPHIPVDRRAPVADFARIAPQYPVFRVDRQNGSGRPMRKHHWWRWIAASLVALVLLVVLAVGLFIKLQPSPAPLTFPANATRPDGPLDGIWGPAKGSLAGFRVSQTALGFSSEVVGRTNGVTGTIIVSDGRVTTAMFRIDLSTLTVSGKKQPQFAASLDTANHPVATFTLTQPVRLGPAFASGSTITARCSGDLTLRGVSRLVTFPIAGRRDGTALEVAGSVPVTFSAWGIKGPSGFGLLGSLADHGVAEFLIILRRA
jgi:polyisoprenoid-binding protein YceI